MRLHPLALVLPLLALALYACVDATPPRLRPEAGQYLVEGRIVDQPGLSRLSVRRSVLRSQRIFLEPGRDVRVVSVDDGGAETAWAGQDGNFRPPPGFRPETGRAYFVRIITAEGDVLESDPETMPPPVPIDSLYYRFDQEAYFDDGLQNFVPAFELFIDFADDPASRNYYRTTFRKWEELESCYFCPPRSRYDTAALQCRPWRENIFGWDYRCNTRCWGIDSSRQLTVHSDELTNGNYQRGVAAGRSPYLNFITARLFEVRLYSTSGPTYDYNRNFRSLSEEAAGLNAPAPTPLVGNVRFRGARSNELVLGQVGVSSVTTRRLFVRPREHGGFPLAVRPPLLFEPKNDSLDRPPDVPCVGLTRTPVRPRGWAPP